MMISKIKVVASIGFIGLLTLGVTSTEKVKHLKQDSIEFIALEQNEDSDDLDYSFLADRTLAKIIRNKYFYKPSYDCVGKAIKATRKLPSKFICKVSDMGYRVYFAKDLEGVEGITHLRRHIMLLAEDTKDLEFVTLHEFGHIFYDLQSQKYWENMFNAYNKEAQKYRGYNPPYAKKDLSEYHASSFAQFILEPEELKVSRPVTFKLIDEAVKGL